MDQSILSKRHVFIIGEDLLFEEGIAHMLDSKTDMQVSKQRLKDDAWLMDVMSQHQPDIILLAESEILNSAHLIHLLFCNPSVKVLWIVVVRLENNLVDVYEQPQQMGGGKVCRQQQFSVNNHDELVAIVQGDFTLIPYNFFSLLPCGCVPAS